MKILTNSIGQLLKNLPVDYDLCVERLRGFMKTNFLSLMPESSPIASDVESYSEAQLEFIIKEYSCFSNEAIHMLLDAMIRNFDWKTLYKEIERNIEEEKGSETKHIPHLEMMRQGYKNDLGIDTDIVHPSLITQNFLRKMRKIFNHPDNAFSAGALFALEGTAIPEFYILDKIVQQLEKLKGETAQLKYRNGLTKIYIDGHKEFEIEHEAGLVNSIKPFINEKNILKLAQGYLSVCYTMNLWWIQVAEESFALETSRYLSVQDTELYDIRKVFS